MASQSREALLGALIFSILISATVITVIVNDYTGQDTLVGITSFNPSYGGAAYLTGQDYTSGSGYNTNVSFFTGVTSDRFEQVDGAGLVQIGNYKGYSSNSALGGAGLVFVQGVSNTNGIYDVTYYINNSISASRWMVCPRLITASEFTGSDVRLIFDEDEIYIPEYSALGYLIGFDKRFTFPYTGANGAGNSDIEIRTLYNEQKKEVTVYYDGTELFTATGLQDYSAIDQAASFLRGGPYYAATGSDTIGFTITKIGTIITYTTAQSIWDTLNSVFTFATTIGAVVVWTLPENIFPLWLNIILIKSQIVVLIYMIVELIRGD